ncbi:hypothetical protein E2C01_000399 [Portunus trituberculatus]|uniref:Uncharacterized protein n=1 Tax=Portunus trituberculatus TaxID=210409 RepID=A0A5B7CDZ5_PORTR|nr:hypothetical protein [Portunus trituberculatus]
MSGGGNVDLSASPPPPPPPPPPSVIDETRNMYRKGEKACLLFSDVKILALFSNLDPLIV